MRPLVVRSVMGSWSHSWSTTMCVKRGLATLTDGIPRLGITDDYLGTSASYFAHIPPSKLQITTFHDTVVPANESEAARLVERLKPFDMISCVRERTSFPASLLSRLPNLKLLLATGTQFETFDLGTARKLGITVVGCGTHRLCRASPLKYQEAKCSSHHAAHLGIDSSLGT